MAGFLNSALPSDDEEDDDYNPTADNTAEGEDLPQTAAASRGGSRKKRRRGAAIAAEEGEVNEEEDGNDEEEEELDAEAAAAAELADPRVQAKRAKVASLWQEINARAAAKGSATVRPPSAAVNLAALCRSASTGGKKAKPADPDAIWMRSLGLLKKPNKPADAASLWQSKTQTAASATAAAHTTPAAAAAGTSTDPSAAEKRALAAAALAAARDATNAGSRLGKVAVTELRRFAGKDIQVTLHVDKDSKEAQRAAARAAAPPPPPSTSGLDAVLAEIEKKKKVSVLDKTKADWSEYKAANTKVDEELEMYKRSGEQYLEKQDFLKRAELREYEKERDLRLASDVRTRGRL